MTKLRHLYIDEESHRLAKTQASKQGLTIQKWLERTIRQETAKGLYNCIGCGRKFETEKGALEHLCEGRDEK